jgi:hypothetical protein
MLKMLNDLLATKFVFVYFHLGHKNESISYDICMFSLIGLFISCLIVDKSSNTFLKITAAQNKAVRTHFCNPNGQAPDGQERYIEAAHCLKSTERVS